MYVFIMHLFFFLFFYRLYVNIVIILFSARVRNNFTSVFASHTVLQSVVLPNRHCLTWRVPTHRAAYRLSSVWYWKKKTPWRVESSATLHNTTASDEHRIPFPVSVLLLSMTCRCINLRAALERTYAIAASDNGGKR